MGAKIPPMLSLFPGPLCQVLPMGLVFIDGQCDDELWKPTVQYLTIFQTIPHLENR